MMIDCSADIVLPGWGFDFGTQVFEQYGQPNHIYFLYHGFVLNNNSFDCVHVDLFMSAEEMGVIDWTKHRPLLQVYQLSMFSFFFLVFFSHVVYRNWGCGTLRLLFIIA